MPAARLPWQSCVRGALCFSSCCPSFPLRHCIISWAPYDATRRCADRARAFASLQYSDAALYNQLRYYSYLFSAEKALKGAAGPAALGKLATHAPFEWTSHAHGAIPDEIQALVNVQAEFLHTMTKAVDKYLEQCGRRWVELGSLFSFMKV